MSLIYDALRGTVPKKPGLKPKGSIDNFPLARELSKAQEGRRRAVRMGAIILMTFAVIPLLFYVVQKRPKFPVHKAIQEAKVPTEVTKPGHSFKEIVSPTVLFQQGTNHYENGELEQAKVAFQKALEIKPNYTHAHNNLGVVYYQKGKVNEGIQEFKQALSDDPYYPEAHFNLAVALEGKGDRQNALHHYERFIQLASAAYGIQVQKVRVHMEELRK